jgi:hypothetical protein
MRLFALGIRHRIRASAAARRQRVIQQTHSVRISV